MKPRKRRTKFSKTPLSKVKPYYKYGGNVRFDVRSKNSYSTWVKIITKLHDPATERFSFFWKIVEKGYPRFRRGVPYFMVSDFPAPYSNSPAHIVWGIAFAKPP